MYKIFGLKFFVSEEREINQGEWIAERRAE